VTLVLDLQVDALVVEPCLEVREVLVGRVDDARHVVLELLGLVGHGVRGQVAGEAQEPEEADIDGRDRQPAVAQRALEERHERVEHQRDDGRRDEDQQHGAGGTRDDPDRQDADREHDQLHPARHDDRLRSDGWRLAFERVVTLEFAVDVSVAHGSAREYGPW
jgi:hypothetical protein